jgi:hypothetical protein
VPTTAAGTRPQPISAALQLLRTPPFYLIPVVSSERGIVTMAVVQIRSIERIERIDSIEREARS